MSSEKQSPVAEIDTIFVCSNALFKKVSLNIGEKEVYIMMSDEYARDHAPMEFYRHICMLELYCKYGNKHLKRLFPEK